MSNRRFIVGISLICIAIIVIGAFFFYSARLSVHEHNEGDVYVISEEKVVS